jgi:hypothetical protein
MLALYRWLLRLYPAAYFREYAGEMTWVFRQAEQAASAKHSRARVWFGIRELGGVVKGALRERIFGDAGWKLSRRSDMRPEFRFPRSTVILMWVILAGVVLAINKAKAVVAMNEGLRPEIVAFWHPLFWLYPFAVVVAIVGAVWGILFALRRTGMHRLANVQTSPERQ